MDYPFRVGDTYRNRLGSYEVVSIEEPNITIRYDDGKLFQGDIATLQRIWENMQAEADPPPLRAVERERGKRVKAAAPAKASGKERPGTGRSGSGQRGSKFGGLVEDDFKADVTGTEWRSRQNLGGLLAQHMTDRLGTRFASWPIYHRAAVYLTYEDRYTNTHDEGTPHAKFALELNPDSARYGFFIERTLGDLDERWDWQRFILALRRDDPTLAGIAAAMREHGVTAEPWLTEESKAYTRLGRLVAEPEGLSWYEADGATGVPISWPAFAAYLSEPRLGTWLDLYFYAEIKKEDAIGLGVDIADQAVRAYVGLLPLYSMSLR